MGPGSPQAAGSVPAARPGTHVIGARAPRLKQPHRSGEDYFGHLQLLSGGGVPPAPSFYVTTSYPWEQGQDIAQMSDFCDYLDVTHRYELRARSPLAVWRAGAHRAQLVGTLKVAANRHEETSGERHAQP